MPRGEANSRQPPSLRRLRQQAEAGRLDLFRAEALELAAEATDSRELLELGGLFLAYGLVSDAAACYRRVQAMAPRDLRPVINLANVARETGEHGQARRWYSELLRQLPNQPVLRRNALVSLEYDPEVSDAERLTQARAWGAWAIAQAGGDQPRPPVRPLAGRVLRVGYVSADLCQHTVGLLVKDVLRAHDPQRTTVFAYSAGAVKDWVTDAIAERCTLRAVAGLDDAALAAQIRADAIDVLVDLSGHTGGSRLTVFAQRPAPVLVSWLGYFATTGLPTMDAVLLDPWHAPPGTEAQFVEPLRRLPSRFCYQPVSWAPEPAPPPCLRNGYVTFGCFNNTAKLNPPVLALWSTLLRRVPDARLVLKWRTFNDAAFRERVRATFIAEGIVAERIELRGASFHSGVLKEYGDIDIALDPFPFTGGLTSCEALWMGVPVVTWPQSRVVSRQTWALLNLIGHPELGAMDGEGVVRIAVELANDWERLAHLRATLRDRMRDSVLCDVEGFTRNLESELVATYEECARDP